MDTSTPKNIRRRSLHINSVSPLSNKSVCAANDITKSFIHDDETERKRRRTLIGETSENILDSNTKIKVKTNQVLDYFQLCVKLYIENKINSKNVWTLNIIDSIEEVLKSHEKSKNFFNVGGTSLDLCSKIYGLRVDDIHTSCLKLASNMCRLEAKEDSEAAKDSAEEDEDDQVQNRKKTRKARSRQQPAICKDEQSISQVIKKLDTNYSLNQTGADSMNTQFLLTNTLRQDLSGCGLLFRSTNICWQSHYNLDPVSEKNCPFPMISVQKGEICKAFSGLDFSEWSPEDESLMPEESVAKIVFDKHGLPVLELNESFNNDCENGSNHMESELRNEQLDHINYLGSEKYDSIISSNTNSSQVSLINKNRVTQLWAGPSHWKLKYIRSEVPKFVAIDLQKKKSKTINKCEDSPIDFFNYVELSKAKYKSKTSTLSRNPQKLLVCPNLIKSNYYNRGIKLACKQITVFARNDYDEEGEVLEHDLPYNYQNPNDSLYCPETTLNNDSHHSSNQDYEIANNKENELPLSENVQIFTSENLIAPPQSVPHFSIPYALKAKQVDMKKLKSTIWKLISDETSEQTKENNSNEGVAFSTIVKKVPGSMNKRMRMDLSVSTIFVSLLHLANEHNLQIESEENNLSDFKIKL